MIRKGFLEKKVCISILNYNHAEMTLRCLESVLAQEQVPFLPVITDNASTDDSLSVIVSYFDRKGYSYRLFRPGEDFTVPGGYFPDVILLQTGRNGGFSFGNNVALRFARSTPGFSHVLLLNNDVVLEKRFLIELTEYQRLCSDRYPGHPVVLGAVEKDLHGKVRHRGIHNLNILTGLVFPRPLFPSFAYIVGACLFLPVQAPFLDEGYFLYYDDAAYSKILLKNGYHLDQCEKAVYRHDIGGTTRANPKLYTVIFRSMRHFYRDHYPLAYPVVILSRTLLELVRGRLPVAAELLRSAFRNPTS